MHAEIKDFMKKQIHNSIRLGCPNSIDSSALLLSYA